MKELKDDSRHKKPKQTKLPALGEPRTGILTHKQVCIAKGTEVE